jgi:RNA polymerase sigma-70 factor (ECF subfamily)
MRIPVTPVEIASASDDAVAGGSDDRSLALRARTDPAAFGLLYDRYVDSVYRFCLRRLGEREEAEDATARVFAKALAAMPRYRDNAPSFRAWLFAIARNAVVDEVRSRRPDLQLDAAVDLPDSSASPEAIVLATESERDTAALLGRLPPEQRHVVELRLAGLSLAETAHALGKTPIAAKVTQHRAYRRLRVLLEGQGEGKGASDAQR